jgi:hypothetical protein
MKKFWMFLKWLLLDECDGDCAKKCKECHIDATYTIKGEFKKEEPH